MPLTSVSRRLGLILLGVGGLVSALTVLVRAADHRDSALLTANPGQDIADVYAFRSPANPSNLVLAMTVAGLQAPSDAGSVRFPPDVVYQFKLDTDGDAVEDWVVQAYAVGRGAAQTVKFLGPARPVRTGTVNSLLKDSPLVVPASYGAEARRAQRDGIQVFAGLRDDPFFFDLVQFNAILGGMASGFRNPGVDTFAGTNVLALVVEFPVALIGGATRLGVWGTANLLQN